MKLSSTRFRWMLALSLLVAVDGLLPKAVRAETRMAAALTPEAVGAAIDAANDGDTVLLPAGTAVWSKKSWNTGHSPMVKAITIQGAGIDQTIITVDKSKNGNTSFNLEGTEGKPFRVTGITLDGSLHPNEASWGALMMSVAGAAAFAATPVDIYQDMQSGANGDVLTPALMNASHHGGGKWSIDKGELWVSTAKPRDLPGPVSVGGTTCAAKGAGRCWMVRDDKSLNAVTCTLPGPCRKITLACYYTPGVTISFGNQFDTILMSGNHGYAVLQTRNDDGKGPYFRAHSCTTGWKTTFSPGQIRVLSGKTYWVNLHFDAEQGKTSVAAFDPDNNFAQVGEVVVANSWLDSTGMRWIGFGRADNHGPNPTAKTQSYFQQILIDYTRGAFPLIPGREAR